MDDIERLMLEREMFPSVILENDGKFYIPLTGQIPPLHESIVENGFPIYDVPALIDIVESALEDTILDVEGLPENVREKYDSFLSGMEKEI